MRGLKPILALAGLAVLSAGAFAQSFTLNVDPTVFDSGGTFGSDPQSTTFGSGGSGGIGTYVGGPRSGGFMSAYASVTANLVDPGDGTINFNDGYNTVNAPSSGGVNIGFADALATSDYSFTTFGTFSVTVTFASIVSSLENGVVDPTAFGMQDVYVGLDGNVQTSPGFPAPPTGTYTFTGGAGNHVLSFDDSSNILGNLGTRTGTLSEQLTFTITPVPAPEPVSMAFLGLGVVGLIARRARRRN
jgi:MYXO-CTERM domain-containing protein